MHREEQEQEHREELREALENPAVDLCELEKDIRLKVRCAPTSSCPQKSSSSRFRHCG
jgi:hypothetical protein